MFLLSPCLFLEGGSLLFSGLLRMKASLCHRKGNSPLAFPCCASSSSTSPCSRPWRNAQPVSLAALISLHPQLMKHVQPRCSSGPREKCKLSRLAVAFHELRVRGWRLACSGNARECLPWESKVQQLRLCSCFLERSPMPRSPSIKAIHEGDPS